MDSGGHAATQRTTYGGSAAAAPVEGLMQVQQYKLWPHDGQEAATQTDRDTLQRTLSTLVQRLRGPAPQQAAQVRSTASVSYVRESASQQIGAAPGTARLPHLTFRPLGLQVISNAYADAMTQQLLTEAVTSTMFSSSMDEGSQKEYLLRPSGRSGIIAQQGGAVCVINGAAALAKRLTSCSFAVLHYELTQDGTLLPCLASVPAADAPPASQPATAASTPVSAVEALTSLVSGSTVQLCVSCKKGIGGTYPARCFARRLSGLTSRDLLPSSDSLAMELGNCLDSILDKVTNVATVARIVRMSPAAVASDECAEDEEKHDRNAAFVAPVSTRSPRLKTSEERLAASRLPGLKLYSLSCRLELFVQANMWESLSRDQRNAMYSAVCGLERRLMKQVAVSSRARLLAFSESLAASTDVELRSPAEQNGSVTCGKTASCCSSGVDSAELANTEPGPSAQPAGLAVPATKAAQHQATQQDELLAPQTPQKHAPRRPNLEASPGARAYQPCSESGHLELALSSREAASAMAYAAASTCAGAAAAVQRPAAQAAVRPAAAATDTSAAALLPHISEAEAVALAAICAQAASAAERSAAGHFPWPLYFIATRDCFTFELIASTKQVSTESRCFMQTDYFFSPEGYPDNYSEAIRQPACTHTAGTLLPVGITAYTEIFSQSELADIEARSDAVVATAGLGALPPQAVCRTLGKAGNLRRTKFFFGARYLWTREQLEAADAHRAAGVRTDVPPVPPWVQRQVAAPLEAAGVLPTDFINSAALNVYHDGSEGIQSHFDDAARFERPIVSLRLFSDSRLSFGTQLYGYSNGAFCIDMPRGCVLVMHPGGYAVTGVKHCVRPMDMTGKSAGLILRRIWAPVLQQAREIQLEQLTAAAARWMLHDTLPAPPLPAVLLPPSAGLVKKRRPLDPQRHVAAHCRAALDACISHIEQTTSRSQGSRKRDRSGAEVAAVLASMVRNVEASVAADSSRSQRQLASAQPAPQAAGTAAGHPVCFACERGGSWVVDGSQGDLQTSLWACVGPCHRSFHRSCLPPGQDGLCHECTSRSWACSSCRRSGSAGNPLVRCAVPRCGRCYHTLCLPPSGAAAGTASGAVADGSGKSPAEHDAPAAVAARPTPAAPSPVACPTHVCHGCGACGKGVRLLHCIRCPRAWCHRCKPLGARLLSKRLVRCGHHLPLQLGQRGSAPAQVQPTHTPTGQAAAQTLSLPQQAQQQQSPLLVAGRAATAPRLPAEAPLSPGTASCSSAAPAANGAPDPANSVSQPSPTLRSPNMARASLKRSAPEHPGRAGGLLPATPLHAAHPHNPHVTPLRKVMRYDWAAERR